MDVVIGGEWESIQTAMRLCKQGKKVTLIAPREFVFFRTLTVAVAAGDVPFEKATLPLAPIAQKYGFTLLVDRVKTVHTHKKVLKLSKISLSYETLYETPTCEPLAIEGEDRALNLSHQPGVTMLLADKLRHITQDATIVIAFGSSRHATLCMELALALSKKAHVILLGPQEYKTSARQNRWEKILNRRGVTCRWGALPASITSEGVILEDGALMGASLVVCMPACKNETALTQPQEPTIEGYGRYSFVRLGAFAMAVPYLATSLKTLTVFAMKMRYNLLKRGI